MGGSKITRQTDGQTESSINGSKITLQTDGWLDSKMVGSKMTRQKNVFLADIDPYFGELIRKPFFSKYDIASSEGDRTEHKPLPWTGLDSKGMARSSGTRR